MSLRIRCFINFFLIFQPITLQTSNYFLYARDVTSDDISLSNPKSALVALQAHRPVTCRSASLKALGISFLMPHMKKGLDVADATHHFAFWEDVEYQEYLIRLFDYIKADSVRHGHRRGLPIGRATLQRFYRDMCPSTSGNPNWTRDIGNHRPDLLQAILMEAAENEPLESVTGKGPLSTDDNKERLLEKMWSGGVYELLRVIRNCSAHFLEMTTLPPLTAPLGPQFINFWRHCFPMLCTGAALIGINLDLHTNDSFKQFFTCTNLTFYYAQKNLNASGKFLQPLDKNRHQ